MPLLHRVVVCDKNLSVAQSFANAFQDSSFFDVIATETSGAHLLEKLKTLSFDLLVAEINLGPISLFDVTERASQQYALPKVIVLADKWSDFSITKSIKCGYKGYLLKSEPLQTVIYKLRRIARNQSIFPETCDNKYYFYDTKREVYRLRPNQRWNSLTMRQVEVLTKLAVGLTVKEIATDFHISEKSVESHKYRIMEKLNIHNRVELARFAIRNQLIEP
jgi:DNA-binding NarL/FixJ family response regulator